MDTTFLRLAFGAISILAVIYLIWPQVMMWRDRVDEPCCGSCRYPVAGITVMTCPECGGDLRINGIVTSAMLVRRRRSATTSIAVWTLAWGFAGFLLALGASMFVHGMYKSVKNYSISSTTTPGVTASITLTTVGWRDPPTEREFDVDVRNPVSKAASGRAVFDWPGAAVSRREGSAAGVWSRVDPESLANWFTTAGIANPTLSATDFFNDVGTIADQAYNMGSSVASGTSWTASGSGVRMWYFTPMWIHVSSFLTWIAVWTGGAWLLKRRFLARTGSARIVIRDA